MSHPPLQARTACWGRWSISLQRMTWQRKIQAKVATEEQIPPRTVFNLLNVTPSTYFSVYFIIDKQSLSSNRFLSQIQILT